MICARCGKDASVSLSTPIGQQCAGCFREYVEPQPVGNFSDAEREEARDELDRKARERKQLASMRSPARSPSGAGYFDGGVQYVPDEDGYW